eukprot:gene3083-3854_t
MPAVSTQSNNLKQKKKNVELDKVVAQKDNNNVIGDKQKESKWETMKTEILFIFCVAGIYIFYLLYGVSQEKLNIMTYGDDKKIFGYTAFLLAAQCFFNMISAKVVSLFQKNDRDVTPPIKYGLVSVLLVASTFLSNYSIRFISYPTQVLAKSCKPIPVMLMGILFFKRKYSILKYFIVVIITVGIAIFMLPNSNKYTKEHPHMLYGNILLLSSLLMDGVMGPFQDNLVSKYKPSSTNMMLNTNIWNFIFFLIMTIFNGELSEATQFIFQYPEVLKQISLFCITSALGQQFIYLTTNKFGSLNCSTITTTRKFFSILVSIFWFGHSITFLQWVSIAMVFSGLGLDVFQSYTKKLKSA